MEDMQMHDQAKREVLKQLQDFVSNLDLQNLKGPAQVEMKAEIEPSPEVAELDPEKTKMFEQGLREKMPMDQDQQQPSPSDEKPEDEAGMLDKLKDMYESIQS